uniref:Uncharacterized protein n=1 Tax=viral metagenome TaxID=1070528 RepID=A0A6H1ZFE3_9ZZZZ
MIMIREIRRWFKIRKAIKRYKQLGAMIDSIDRAFTKAKISRQKRRQFWDDFVRSPEARKKFVKDMGRNI